MNKKSMGSKPATLTVIDTDREEIATALEQGSDRLEASEEKVLRMRYGVAAPLSLQLSSQGQGQPDTEEVLMSLEMELFRQMKQLQAQAKARAESRSESEVEAPSNAPNPQRDKIIAALRRGS